VRYHVKPSQWVKLRTRGFTWNAAEFSNSNGE
jgi:hypothetical protein